MTGRGNRADLWTIDRIPPEVAGHPSPEDHGASATEDYGVSTGCPQAIPVRRSISRTARNAGARHVCKRWPPCNRRSGEPK